MLLEAEGIRKTYATRDGAVCALRDARISIDEGEVIGLVGVSGSGKSTMASILAGLERADAGRISFQGVECDAAQRIGRRPPAFRASLAGMQMVFQNPASTFSERMRIGPGIAEGIAYRGVPRRERRRRVLEALDMVGLPRSYADKHAWELSGGECQRAAIARAMISRPRLLICDEPTSALDVTIQAQIVHLLLRLCAEMDMSCLFISHDLALVRGMCGRVYVMDAGAVVEEGSSDEVFEHPRSNAARMLAASSAISLQGAYPRSSARSASGVVVGAIR